MGRDAGMVDESLSKHGQTISIKVEPYLNFEANVKSADVRSTKTIRVARAKSWFRSRHDEIRSR